MERLEAGAVRGRERVARRLAALGRGTLLALESFEVRRISFCLDSLLHIRSGKCDGRHRRGPSAAGALAARPLDQLT